METKNINGHIVCYNLFRYKTFNEIKVFLEGDDFKNICDNLKEKTVIVLGGDGTLLKAIKQNYKLGYPFLGINHGNKGFLLNNRDYISKNSTFKKVSYPIIDVELNFIGNIYNDIFINEVNITAGGGNLVDLDISISDNQKINIKGDGVVISTPAGSTGYNLSLRGPILMHNLGVLVISPKASWAPISQNPIVLSDNNQVNITNIGRNSLLEVYCDGRKLFSSDKNNVKIKIKKSEYVADFLIENSYVDIWDNKIFN